MLAATRDDDVLLTRSEFHPVLFNRNAEKDQHYYVYLQNPCVMGFLIHALLQIGAIWIRVSSPAAQQESLSSAPS